MLLKSNKNKEALNHLKGGRKAEQAKTALNICLRNLDEKDSFNLAAFESKLHLFSAKSQRFNQHTLKMATAWVKGLVDLGGTEILPAIKFALYMIIELCITLKIITPEDWLRKADRFHCILNERMELDELKNDLGEVDVKYLVQLSRDL